MECVIDWGGGSMFWLFIGGKKLKRSNQHLLCSRLAKVQRPGSPAIAPVPRSSCTWQKNEHAREHILHTSREIKLPRTRTNFLSSAVFWVKQHLTFVRQSKTNNVTLRYFRPSPKGDGDSWRQQSCGVDPAEIYPILKNILLFIQKCAFNRAWIM